MDFISCLMKKSWRQLRSVSMERTLTFSVLGWWHLNTVSKCITLEGNYIVTYWLTLVFRVYMVPISLTWTKTQSKNNHNKVKRGLVYIYLACWLDWFYLGLQLILHYFSETDQNSKYSKTLDGPDTLIVFRPVLKGIYKCDFFAFLFASLNIKPLPKRDLFSKEKSLFKKVARSFLSEYIHSQKDDKGNFYRVGSETSKVH